MKPLTIVLLTCWMIIAFTAAERSCIKNPDDRACIFIDFMKGE